MTASSTLSPGKENRRSGSHPDSNGSNSSWARRSLDNFSFDPYNTNEATKSISPDEYKPQSPSIFAIQENTILLAGIPVYRLSTPLSSTNALLTLSSINNGQSLYTIEYLGELNSLYIRSCHPSSYQGFGELKFGRHLSGRRWDLCYDGCMVLSRREGREKSNTEGGESAESTRWIDGEGVVVAEEVGEKGGALVVHGEEEANEQMRVLVVAAWTAKRWHEVTFEERNGSQNEVLKLDGKAMRSRTRMSGRSMNRFLGNLFSGL